MFASVAYKATIVALFATLIGAVYHDVRYGDSIVNRSSTTIAHFKRVHPCPVTGSSEGACPGWHVDHVIPLACRGKDVIENLQWLPVEIKTCEEWYCKDRFERKIYCR